MSSKNAWFAASGVVVGLCCLVGLTACAAGPQSAAPSVATAAPSETDPGKLLEKHCGRCHVLDTIMHYQKTPQQWERTITRMLDRGVKMSKAERAVLRDYLGAIGEAINQ